MMDQQTKIKEWFFDNLENIIDETKMSSEEMNSAIEENDYVFSDEIETQCMDDLRKTIVEQCATSTNCSYDECNGVLEEKVIGLFYALE